MTYNTKHISIYSEQIQPTPIQITSQINVYLGTSIYHTTPQAMGLACIVTDLSAVSVRGRKDFSFTGNFSSSSSASNPSMIL